MTPIKFTIPIKCTTITKTIDYIHKGLITIVGTMFCGFIGFAVGFFMGIVVEFCIGLLMNNPLNLTDEVTKHPITLASMGIGVILGIILYLQYANVIEITCIKEKTL